jgi:sporulation protein YlmC with PRC-barrel domain
MILTAKELISLPVETKSGIAIGRVFDFEIEVDSGIVSKFYVKKGIIEDFLKKDHFIISRSQVISIDKNKMIVEDGLETEKNTGRVLGEAGDLGESKMVVTSVKE